MGSVTGIERSNENHLGGSSICCPRAMHVVLTENPSCANDASFLMASSADRTLCSMSNLELSADVAYKLYHSYNIISSQNLKARQQQLQQKASLSCTSLA